MKTVYYPDEKEFGAVLPGDGFMNIPTTLLLLPWG